MDHRLRKALESLAFWNTILGWIMVAGGIISAISGLVPFVFPALLGAFSAYLGYCLIKSGREAKDLLQKGDENDLLLMVESLARYFKLQGIYLIACLIVVVLFVSVLFMIGFSLSELQ